jgi:hypothetical protein
MSSERDAEHGAGPAAPSTSGRRSPPKLSPAAIASVAPRDLSRVDQLERQVRRLQAEQLDAAARYERLCVKLDALVAQIEGRFEQLAADR